MKRALLATLARIDALSRRDRYSLLGGLLAAAIGVQAMWLLPMRDRRLAITTSVAEEDRSRSDALATATDEKTQALELLRSHNADLENKLAVLGLKATQREPVAGFVARTLRGNGVRLVALTALAVEELTLPMLAGETDAAAAATPAPGAGTTAAPTLFRHRAEVRLEGPVQGVVQTLDQLERQLVPLRVERVRLFPSGPTGTAGAVQASVVLTTISQERTWLAL
jgi:predicted outer membrane lipoprotein